MKCKLCSKKTEHLEIHHIIPKSRGGSDDECNLIKLCTECHGLAHDVCFVNERGGLIKEAIVIKKIQDEVDRKWLDDNEKFVSEKMSKLYNKNKDMYMLMILLLEQGKLTASHIKKWYIENKVTLKTSITIS